MAIAYSRDDSQKRILLTATGSVSKDDAIEALQRQAAESVWTYAILFDVRVADALPKPSELLEILDYVRRQVVAHGPRGPLAIVAEPSRNEQRLRTYMSLSDPSRRLATFTAIDTAVRWLEEQREAGT
jgi:hypothetical protein